MNSISINIVPTQSSIIARGPSSSIATSLNRFTYNILGQDIEADSTYGDPTIGICIALINTLGIKYYEELKKQKITFNGKIGDFLEERLKSYYRDSKIDQVIE